jgi:hypothetical protein
MALIFRPEANINIQWGNEEYIPQAAAMYDKLHFSRRHVDDSEVPREVREDGDPDHTMYLYRQGDCIGRVHGAEMEHLKAELDHRLCE